MKALAYIGLLGLAMLPELSAAASSGKAAPTVGDLGRRTIEVRKDATVDRSAARAMQSYQQFLELQNTDPKLRAEALRRLGDLNLESGELERLSNEVTQLDLQGAEAIRLYSTLLKAYPAETLKPGDVLITNDPWLCAGHLFDIAIVTPAFRNGRLVGLMGYSMPIFWLGLIGLLVFYGKLDWVAGPGRLDPSFSMMMEFKLTQYTGMVLIDSALNGAWDVFANAVSHIILPAGLLGYVSMAYISRMTRSFMMNELGQEYITTARVKGMPEWRVIWVHAMKNVLVPLITVIALSYAYLLEGSVLTETIFAWPGLGSYITDALFGADMPAVLGGTVVVGVAFVTLNMASDILYRLVDPRART